MMWVKRLCLHVY